MLKDNSNEFYPWESFLPQFIFPQTHPFPEFLVWYADRYLPSEKNIIAQNSETLFFVTSCWERDSPRVVLGLKAHVKSIFVI